MTNALLPAAAAVVLATCTVIAIIALLRPVLRHFCGAANVLKLWRILPIALAAVALPKNGPSTQATITSYMQRTVGSVLFAIAPEPVSNPATTATRWKEIALAFWLAGAAIAATYMFVAHRRFSKKISWGPRRGVLPPNVGPAVLGAIRPRLALPADFRSRYSAQERRLILLHEAIHMRRHDGLANLGMSILLVLQWFNPLVHWASRAMCRDQESACDAVVVTRHPGALRVYADALLKTHAEMHHLPLVCRWQAYHPTVERIAMLKSHRDIRANGPLATLLFVCGGTVGGAIAYTVQPGTPAAPPVTAAWETQKVGVNVQALNFKTFVDNVSSIQKLDIVNTEKLAGKKISMQAREVPAGSLLRTALFCHGFSLIDRPGGYAVEDSVVKPPQVDPTACIDAVFAP